MQYGEWNIFFWYCLNTTVNAIEKNCLAVQNEQGT